MIEAQPLRRGVQRPKPVGVSQRVESTLLSPPAGTGPTSAAARRGQAHRHPILWRRYHEGGMVVALMPTKTCTVSFTGPTGVCHSVEVSADTLYEAAIVGFSLLKRGGWVDPIAPGTRFQIQVRQPGTTHCVSIAQLRRWVEG